MNKTIQQVCEAIYGCGVVEAPAEAIIWAAERLPKERAREEVRRVNRLRAKHGRPIVHVPYGHVAF